MADEADNSDANIEAHLNAQLRNINLKPEHEPTGQCLNCEEVLPDNVRWCDEYCRDDFLKDQARRNRK